MPLLAGTGLLDTLPDALAAADRIGYPVMLKATAGGGGIGMQACHTADDLTSAWDNVRRLAGASFSSSGVFLERLVVGARHVEVQVFGNGEGHVVTVGDRDCSLQRRNQKVVEESPTPGLPDSVRATITEAAQRLCASVDYRSAGTVEYIYDPVRQEAAFLEVNTRLQVEHPVTEAVYGIDLVEWMLRLAQGDTAVSATPLVASGAAVEARLYAENTDLGNLPSSGTITNLVLPAGARVDTWLEVGAEVSTHYDPMLGKVIVHADTREAAWAALAEALDDTRRRRHRHEPRDAAGHRPHARGARGRALHQHARVGRRRESALRGAEVGHAHHGAGLPGPGGLLAGGHPAVWTHGHTVVPPRQHGARQPGGGPRARVHHDRARAALPHGIARDRDGRARTGHPRRRAVAQWEPVLVPAGGVLAVGTATIGMRMYLLVEGGVDVPSVMGSASTFDLGGIGGASGRALKTGDIIGLATPAVAQLARPVRSERPPGVHQRVDARGARGPARGTGVLHRRRHGDLLRLGVRGALQLGTHRRAAGRSEARVGASATAARRGCTPRTSTTRPTRSELSTSPATLPILLGPDGPSLGGFVCPATVASGHLWKLGQLRPGDTVRFVPVTDAQADDLRERPLDVPEPRPRAGRGRRHPAHRARHRGHTVVRTATLGGREPAGGVRRHAAGTRLADARARAHDGGAGAHRRG